MIRDKKRKLNSWRSFPLLWTECDSCHQEFRFELIWKFVINMPTFMHHTTHAVCRGCAETRVKADDFALSLVKERNKMKSRRPCPPCLPPKKPTGPPNEIIGARG